MCVGVGLLYRCDKAIAAPGYRLDAAALLSVVIEDVAEVRNLDVEVGFPDHPSRQTALMIAPFETSSPFRLANKPNRTHAQARGTDTA